MLTFKQFYEQQIQTNEPDPEDMSLADTKRYAQQMIKRAQMRDRGNTSAANRMTIRDLTAKMRETKDPIKRRDLQRRINELRKQSSQPPTEGSV